MSTTAQTNANRKNAQKSTGPRTDEGKAKSSQNAVKHGLTAARDVIRAESQADFDRHRAGLLADLNPVGPMQALLADRIISLSWRLKRASGVHNQVIDAILTSKLIEDADLLRFRTHDGERPPSQAVLEKVNPALACGRVFWDDFAGYKIIDRTLIYERRIERSFYRALHEFENVRKSGNLTAVQHSQAPAGPCTPGDVSVQNKANSAAASCADTTYEPEQPAEMPADEGQLDVVWPLPMAPSGDSPIFSVPGSPVGLQVMRLSDFPKET
jgi:hypothetical protein